MNESKCSDCGTLVEVKVGGYPEGKHLAWHDNPLDGKPCFRSMMPPARS